MLDFFISFYSVYGYKCFFKVIGFFSRWFLFFITFIVKYIYCFLAFLGRYFRFRFLKNVYFFGGLSDSFSYVYDLVLSLFKRFSLLLKALIFQPLVEKISNIWLVAVLYRFFGFTLPSFFKSVYVFLWDTAVILYVSFCDFFSGGFLIFMVLFFPNLSLVFFFLFFSICIVLVFFFFAIIYIFMAVIKLPL